MTDAPVKTLFDGVLTLNGLLTILSVIVAATAIVGFFERKRRQTEADAQARNDRLMAEITKHNDTIEKRVGAIETGHAELRVMVKDFMPRSEIEQRIEHTRANQRQESEAVGRILTKHDEAISDLRVNAGRLDQKIDGIKGDMAEVKTVVKDMARDTAARLDRMGEQIATLRH